MEKESESEDRIPSKLQAVMPWIVVLGVGLTSFVVIGQFKAHSAQRTRELEVAEESNQLLVQQLNQLAAGYLTPEVNLILAQQKSSTLSTWLLFDQHYVELNQDNPSVTLEIAYAARRVGSVNYFIGNYESAKYYLSIASEHLSTLVSDTPSSNYLYCLELARTKVVLADVSQAEEETSAAIEYINEAIDLIGLDDYEVSSDRDALMKDILVDVGKSLIELGEVSSANRVLHFQLQLLNRLMDEQAESEHVEALLSETQDLLRSVSEPRES